MGEFLYLTSKGSKTDKQHRIEIWSLEYKYKRYCEISDRVKLDSNGVTYTEWKGGFYYQKLITSGTPPGEFSCILNSGVVLSVISLSLTGTSIARNFCPGFIGLPSKVKVAFSLSSGSEYLSHFV